MMLLGRAVAGVVLFVALLPPAASLADSARKQRIAAGPAVGVSERFSRTSPVEVAGLARSEAAPEAAGTGWVPEHEIASRPDRENRTAASAPPGANEFDDPARARSPEAAIGPKAAPVLTGFAALSDTSMSPPDPIIAAGPNHVVVAVNSKWAVFTKSGALILQASATSWFRPQLAEVHAGSLLPYDPQVAYDHFRGRWILVYSATDIVSQSWILLSVSSSSDPTAPWYSWALRGDANGADAAANFSDFPALGYDDTAIYIATNQFRYSDTGFEYAKVRVLKKDALYAGSSQATWSDFWDLEDPASPGSRVHSVRPAQTFGSPGIEYLVSNSPYSTRTFVTLWSLAGAGTAAPSLSAANVSVTATLAPPRANQRGGSPGTSGCPTPCLIDTGRGSITSAVHRNGSVWFSHTVAASGGVYSRARYARISVAAAALLEDEAFGSDGCWYFYPAIAVDDGNNLAMVFGRSCTDEYAGIGLTARSTADSVLEPSVRVKDGVASYVAPVGNTELVNRWGDFFGAALDPSDLGKIWVVGEYAGQGSRWGTYAGQTVVALTAGSCRPDPSTLCLGNGRFRVTTNWRRPDGSTGAGNAVPITDDTGYFWFFDAKNIEVVTKVLDGCGVNGRFWVFSGGLTNVEVTLAVTDTRTGTVATYANPLGTPFEPIQDTSAFATCP
jgi:hypothetical protein